MSNIAIALDFRCVSGALWRSGGQLTLITFVAPVLLLFTRLSSLPNHFLQVFFRTCVLELESF